MESQFNVKVGEFEGPLDLLLSLIEERKMLVSDVSLARVADDFIAYVRAQSSFPAGAAAQFILIAATLLLMKSKALLPMFSMTDEEEGDAKDLEHRLSLYQVFRDIARRLASLKGGRLFFGGLKRDTEPLFSPASDMSVENLTLATATLLREAPHKQIREEVAVKSVVSLEEMMTRLAERIETALTVTFTDFVGTPEDRREIVVGFLAVLELVKRGLLFAEQGEDFSEIRLEYAGTSRPPKYN